MNTTPHLFPTCVSEVLWQTKFRSHGPIPDQPTAHCRAVSYVMHPVQSTVGQPVLSELCLVCHLSVWSPMSCTSLWLGMGNV